MPLAFTSPLLSPRALRPSAKALSPLRKAYHARSCATRPEHVAPPVDATEPLASGEGCAPPSTSYTIEIARSIGEIPAEIWNSFVDAGCKSPFLHHTFLSALEETRCASAETGWTPAHVIVRQDEEIVALAPAYVKMHSMGEFVFDYEWAEAAFAAGIRYYPKLLVGVPFTPATGRRILTRGGRERLLRVVGEGLREVAERIGVSSVHVNFCVGDEVEALGEVGFGERRGVQYHFVNEREGRRFGGFEEFLGEFKSKRRIQIRRERERVREVGVEVVVKRGDEIGVGDVGVMYELYRRTIERLVYGRLYLRREFFERLVGCEEFRKMIVLVLAKRGGKVVGGTFNVVGGGCFYGRYWGCLEEVRCLHFEVCYYRAIEFCIEEGVGRFEPGAGGEFKFPRGFEPVVTKSMHWIRDARLRSAVKRFLDVESVYVGDAVEDMKLHSAIRARQRRQAQNGTQPTS